MLSDVADDLERSVESDLSDDILMSREYMPVFDSGSTIELSIPIDMSKWGKAHFERTQNTRQLTNAIDVLIGGKYHG